jgi:hypothetical protein
LQQEQELNVREEKKFKWDLEDVDKLELELEDKYTKKRQEITKLRQELRKQDILFFIIHCFAGRCSKSKTKKKIKKSS